MAKRTQRSAEGKAQATTAEPKLASNADSEGADAHFIVFDLAGERFGFRLDDVGEIIRIPHLARMPLAPKSLLGLANLGGVVLPVVELRRLLGLPECPLADEMRVIVTGGNAPVGFVVDRIEQLAAVPADRIETDNAGAGSVDPNLLDGVIKGAEGKGTLKILNPGRLLRDEFSRLGSSLGVSNQHAPSSTAVAAASPPGAAAEQKISLVSFELGRQEYALPLGRVREIIQLPSHISKVARSETAVLGVVTLRDRLLPLVSLRVLLGLPADSGRDEAGKVIVLPMGGGAVGVVADRTREILHVDPGAIDPAPSLLTRGEGDAEITSICRLDGGRRLVAVLSPDNLFRSDLVRRVLSEQASQSADGESEGDTMAEEQFIIFRLGEQEYGIPIAAVDEIARPPSRLARLPKAPSFVDGVMNLRGIVVPIVDLRRRFDIAVKDAAGRQRILVLALGGGKTGFMVDGVSEVMKIPESAIRPAPEVSPEQMRLIGRVANLDAQDRMILLVDPAQLLDRIEADVLARFDRSAPERESKAS